MEKTLDCKVNEEAKSSDSVDVKEESKHGRDKKTIVYDLQKEENEVGPRFKDIGGMDELLLQLKREVIQPLNQWESEQMLGIKPISGIFLQGPPGCGKTTLDRAIANEACIPFPEISATKMVSNSQGKSEANIRDAFVKARSTAPSILFIDEIDAIAPTRGATSVRERPIVVELMTCMDESNRLLQQRRSSDFKHGYVLVIAATNCLDALDLALRRPGRFDKEIYLGVPDESSRFAILSMLTKNIKLKESFNLMQIARSSLGFVGADLSALVEKACHIVCERVVNKLDQMVPCKSKDNWEGIVQWIHTVRRQPWFDEEWKKFFYTMSDFEKAAKTVQPLSKRNGFSTVPNAKWEDVGGFDKGEKTLDTHIKNHEGKKTLDADIKKDEGEKTLDADIKKDEGEKTLYAYMKNEEKETLVEQGGIHAKRNGPRFRDIGGLKELLLQLKREVMLPLNLWGTGQIFGMKPPSGILLHGPPGCGKTTLARVIANEARFPFHEISAAAMVSSYQGMSEENIRDEFAKARSSAPSILFIDEIDAIASKRQDNFVHRSRIVIQVMNCMDESNRLLQQRKRSDFKHGYVLVIAATNFPDILDPALRRPGRFDKEIYLLKK